MAKDVDLNSKRWLDLVFEGKNKKFGAYELRKSSSRRHILAIVVVVLIAGLAFVFLPMLIKRTDPPVVPIAQTSVVEFIENPIVPEKMPARAVEVQAPTTFTSIQRTVKFTDEILVVSTDVLPEDLMLNQSELTGSNAAIGTTTNPEGETVGQHPDDVVPPASAQEETFWNPETWPEFNGDLLKWLRSNIQYPPDALELGVEGRVVLRFVVRADGTIGNVEVLRKLHPSCDREALKAVSKMPKWIPGAQGKLPVAVYYTLPVYFKIQK